MTVRVDLQDDVDRLATAVDSLDRSLDDMPLARCVRIYRDLYERGQADPTTVGEATEQLIYLVALLVATVGEPGTK